MHQELAGELRRFMPKPVVDNVRFFAAIDDDRMFPPRRGAKSGRQRVEGWLNRNKSLPKVWRNTLPDQDTRISPQCVLLYPLPKATHLHSLEARDEIA